MSQPKSREQLEAERLRNDAGYRDSTYGNIQATGSAYSSGGFVDRTPDADDICDALSLAARINEASDRRLARLLERARDEIAGLWRERQKLRSEIEALQRRLEARKEGSDEE